MGRENDNNNNNKRGLRNNKQTNKSREKPTERWWRAVVAVVVLAIHTRAYSRARPILKPITKPTKSTRRALLGWLLCMRSALFITSPEFFFSFSLSFASLSPVSPPLVRRRRWLLLLLFFVVVVVIIIIIVAPHPTITNMYTERRGEERIARDTHHSLLFWIERRRHRRRQTTATVATATATLCVCVCLWVMANDVFHSILQSSPPHTAKRARESEGIRGMLNQRRKHTRSHRKTDRPSDGRAEISVHDWAVLSGLLYPFPPAAAAAAVAVAGLMIKHNNNNAPTHSLLLPYSTLLSSVQGKRERDDPWWFPTYVRTCEWVSEHSLDPLIPPPPLLSVGYRHYQVQFSSVVDWKKW